MCEAAAAAARPLMATALRNEDGQLVSFVFVDVSEAIGIADYVEQARQVVAERVTIPPAYRIDWAGQFTYYERAKERLALLVPLTVLLIFFTKSARPLAEVLIMAKSINTKSWGNTLHQRIVC